MRTSSIFKSRWMALLWSAGIIWFAVDIAGGTDQPSGEATQIDNGVEQAISALDGIKSK